MTARACPRLKLRRARTATQVVAHFPELVDVRVWVCACVRDCVPLRVAASLCVSTWVSMPTCLSVSILSAHVHTRLCLCAGGGRDCKQSLQMVAPIGLMTEAGVAQRVMDAVEDRESKGGEQMQQDNTTALACAGAWGSATCSRVQMHTL
eukprot:6182664-Pleurochrysis_carterae.AAC.2